MKRKLLILLLAVICLFSSLALTSCFGDGGGDNTDDGRPTYTVTFVVPEGATFTGESAITVKEGDKIPEPPAPTSEGKIFSGWYSGKSSTSRWNFETGTVTADVTLTAWFAGGGSGCTHEETIPLPEKSTPATCEKDGKLYTKCVKCGLTSFTVVKKFGHNEVTEVIEATCAEDGYTRVTCSNEGCDYERIHSKVYATGNHTYGTSFVTLIPPTKYVGGQEAKICTVCGGSQVFSIPSLAELDGILYDLEIGNYKYTGGSYVNASFVDIAKFAGVSASSYYTVCTANKVNDGSSTTFWCADTLADGARFDGDYLDFVFKEAYDIGMVKVLLPYYTAWELGDDCYVSYDLQALINDEWVSVGVISDKNASPSGIAGSVVYEFDTPVNTSALRLEVSHSTRFSPAMIYEVEIMAATSSTERVTADLISSSTIASSGKYNAYASGADALIDGSQSTEWYTNWREKVQGLVDEVYASLTFPEEKFVTAAQFSIAPDSNKQFSIYSADENGEWVLVNTYKVTVGGGNVSFTDGGELVEIDGAKRVIFTVEIEKFTTGLKLVVDSEAQAYLSKIYEFVPYTAIEQAVGVSRYDGCPHNSFKDVEVVAPTCTEAGYTIQECYGCGFRTVTDATDSYGHYWSDYVVATAASGKEAGTKESSCQNCDAKRTTNYYNELEDATITTYFHNAPAAWAQTLDDGNYLSTYEWIIPKLQKYGWKATAVLSVCYSDVYVKEWEGYFASGALDLGSHSYNHGGYYSGAISENSLLGDVHNAHYWFMSKFAGQRILGFATPNGATSVGTSEYVTSLMGSARNGGNSLYFYTIIDELRSNGKGQNPLVGNITVDEETGEVIFTQSTNKVGELVWVSTRRAWGNMNSYISKNDQNAGPFVFVKKDDGSVLTKYKMVTQSPVIDEETGEQAVDENGNLVWETLEKPIYEETDGGYDYASGSYTFNEKGGTHALLKSPDGLYYYVALSDTKINYVYNKDVNRLADTGETEGTYRYVETRDENGNVTDSYFEWVEVGSYSCSDGVYTFQADNNGEYKLNHVALGTYEKGINDILSVGGMTVECLHGILPEFSNPGYIWSSYTSTNSKFTYLHQTGVWVASYTELVQYMKEQLSATLTTVSRTDTQIELSLTDTLDDYMFNHALTIKVDIDDSWTAENITATQNGEAVYFSVENGYVYVDAVPDCGAIVISYNG
ncbi:MAG: InlB B-repeat-containing protein [Clostridia bacterium]|nr:InlB B-repeat-containing protein [Clostridia bacterium]